MKILVLDNYDSFTYNLVHLVKELGNFKNLDVYRNDKISLDEVAKYDKILISPGPGLPSESGIMMDLIKRYASLKSILGICLGHQGICEVFGAKLFNMKEVVHGQSTLTKITDKEEPLFKNVPSFDDGQVSFLEVKENYSKLKTLKNVKLHKFVF